MGKFAAIRTDDESLSRVQDSLAKAVNPALEVVDKSVNPLLAGIASGKVWTPVALTAPWANYGAPWAVAAYRKDGLGQVWLKGLIKTSSNITSTLSSFPIFTLPAGFRPSDSHVLAAALSAAGSTGVAAVQIDSAGLIRLNSVFSMTLPGTVSWLTLVGSFLAEQ